MYIFRVENSDRMYTLKYIVVQESITFGKDNLFIFWPMYVTEEALKEVLKKCISQDKIEKVSNMLMSKKLEIGEDTIWLNLPSYLKISSTNTKKLGSNSYDTVSVCSFDNHEQIVVEDALLLNFDRITLTQGSDSEINMADATKLDGIKTHINMNSRGYRNHICKKWQKSAWCTKTINSILPTPSPQIVQQ